MRVQLEKASIEDAEAIHQLQVASFLPLLRKYQDHETNPAHDTVERIVDRLKQPSTTYFFIIVDDVRMGAIRVVYDAQKKRARISPIFIIPEYQNKGYGQEAMALAEDMVDAETWELMAPHIKT